MGPPQTDSYSVSQPIVSHPAATCLPHAPPPTPEHYTTLSDRRHNALGQALPQQALPPGPFVPPSHTLPYTDPRFRLQDTVRQPSRSPILPHSVLGITMPHSDPRTMPDTNMVELLIATSYGIPKPAPPYFTSGKESDFALLKMALDSLLSGHTHLTEQFKYQVLLEHLQPLSAHKLAQAYMHNHRPYTTALKALQDKYGQPRQLVQSGLGTILNSPPIQVGDPEAFDNFALSVHALVGMLQSLEGENGYKLKMATEQTTSQLSRWVCRV